MTMRTFALVIIGIATVIIFSNGNNAGGEAGHLGGAIMGLLIMLVWKWRIISQYRNRR
jgi:membrane associated rhomboid family serine protease